VCSTLCFENSLTGASADVDAHVASLWPTAVPHIFKGIKSEAGVKAWIQALCKDEP